MKKYFFFAAVASLMLTACYNDTDDVVVIDNGELRLSTNNVGVTRATVQNDQLTQFANGESIDFFINESGGSGTTYAQPTTLTANGSGGLTGVTLFWPTSGNGVTIYGVYPSGKATAADATSVTFSVAADQSDNDDYRASDLMTGAPTSNPVARTSSAVNVQFTHLLTKIDVNLSAGTGFAIGDLAAAEVHILGTKLTTTFGVQSTTVTAATGAATDIKAFTGAAGSAIIVPQEVSAGNFIKISIGGGDYIYALPANTTFDAKKVYVYNITVNKDGLVVSTSITDWVSAGPAQNVTATLQ